MKNQLRFRLPSVWYRFRFWGFWKCSGGVGWVIWSWLWKICTQRLTFQTTLIVLLHWNYRWLREHRQFDRYLKLRVWIFSVLWSPIFRGKTKMHLKPKVSIYNSRGSAHSWTEQIGRLNRFWRSPVKMAWTFLTRKILIKLMTNSHF